MLRSLSALLVLALALVLSSAHAQQCATYQGVVCKGVINYQIPAANAQLSFITQLESQLSPKVNPEVSQLKDLMQAFYPTCYDAFYRFWCNKNYPRCDPTTGEIQKPCASVCDDVVRTCGIVFKQVNHTEYTPDCSNTGDNAQLIGPSDTCFRMPGALGALVQVPPCPAPLVAAPQGDRQSLVSPTATCFGRCCLPCPAFNIFYKVGNMDVVQTVALYLRAASSILALYVTLTYVFLPNKRRHPSIIVLFVALAMTMWMASVWFSFPDPRNVQCASAVVDYATPANATAAAEGLPLPLSGIAQANMTNNSLCSIQGTLLMFFTHLTVMWVGFLIVNLHLTAVWRSNFLERHFHVVSLLCWLSPLAFTMVGYFGHDVEYAFGITCLLNRSAADKLFFYPLMAIIFPTFIVHLWTFIHIARISMMESEQSETNGATGHSNSQTQLRSNASHNQTSTGKVSANARGRHVAKAVKVQWRPLLLAFMFLVNFLIFWLVYQFELKKLARDQANYAASSGPGGVQSSDTEWLTEWAKCLMAGGGQDRCSAIVQGHVPNLGLIAASDITISLSGFWLFLIFGARVSILYEWRTWFSQRFSRNRRRGTAEPYSNYI
ncbi:hypothetical protein RI367_007569 [Sorochytrium milnesiophthora]